MSSAHELLRADPRKDEVISLWYLKDFMFKPTKLAPKHQHDRGQKSVLQEPALATAVTAQRMMQGKRKSV